MMRIIYLSIIFLLTACGAAKQNARFMSFDWQAHRGGRGLFPENTIPAMLHAVDLNVTTLEMDVVITKDKQVVVSHDPYFNKDITTRPNGSYVTESEEKDLVIYNMNYAEVKTFDVGMKVHPGYLQQKKMPAVKPRLSELIDRVEAYTQQKKLPQKFYNIETKTKPATDNIYHPPPAEFVDLLMQVIQSKHIEPRTIIQSFDVRTLQYLHKNYPGIQTAFLVQGNDNLQQQLSKLGFTPTIYSPEYQLVTETLVKESKEMGMKIVPWTVNNVSKMKELKQWGVNGIITDYPNLAF